MFRRPRTCAFWSAHLREICTSWIFWTSCLLRSAPLKVARTHARAVLTTTRMLHRFTHTVLATVPEDNEESTGGHGNCMHEHPIGDATAFTGFYRDHRGKLQSVYELCEDVADYEEEGGEDEADQVFRAAAEARGDPNVAVNRAESQAQPIRQQGSIANRACAQARPASTSTGATSWQLLSETPWPADRLVCGGLEVRGSATRRTRLDRKVECTIQHGVITFYDPAETGAEAVILAREQVSSIVATIVPDQTRKFSICSGLELIDSTQVWCCAKDQADRNQWLAVLHRLGVDIYCEDSDGEIRRVRQGVQAQPGRTDV